MKKDIPFLITAHARSGTAYTTQLFQAMGLDVGHEIIGKDGIVSWPNIASGKLSWIGNVEQRRFGNIIHQVRDPLKVISSSYTLLDESFDYMFVHIGFPGGPRSLRWYMWTWIKWNELIEKQASWRFRIEDIEKVFPALCKRLGITPPDKMPDIPKTINSRPHPVYTWADLENADAELCKKIKVMAKKYGYKDISSRTSQPHGLKPSVEAQGKSIKKTSEQDIALSLCTMGCSSIDTIENVKKCIASCIEYVDEIIFVNTGASDEIMEAIREFGPKIKIANHTWENDYSAHRTQSTKYAIGDWLWFIDMDEEFFIEPPEGFKGNPVKAFLAEVPEGVNAISLQYRDMHQGREKLRWTVAKIFRSGQVTWKNRKHNKAIYENKSWLFPMPHYVNHYGYDLAPEGIKQKKKKIKEMLELRLQENPEDWEVYFFLAQEKDDFRNALDSAEIYILHREDIKDFNPSIYFTAIQAAMCLEDWKRADYWLGEALKVIPHDLDVNWALARFGQLCQNADLLIQGCRQFIQSYDRLSQDPTCMGGRFVYNYNAEALSYCLYHLALLSLNSGIQYLERLVGVIPQTEEHHRELLEGDLEKELKKIGVTWILKDKDGSRRGAEAQRKTL